MSDLPNTFETASIKSDSSEPVTPLAMLDESFQSEQKLEQTPELEPESTLSEPANSLMDELISGPLLDTEPVLEPTKSANTSDSTEVIKKYLSCGICSQILYQPVTLFCQHNFCRTCLLQLVKKPYQHQGPPGSPWVAFNQNGNLLSLCPVCQRRFFLPPNKMHNYELDQLIEEMIDDPEYFQERKKEDLKMNPDLQNEAKEELKQELLATILNEIPPDPKLSSQPTVNQFANCPQLSHPPLHMSSSWIERFNDLCTKYLMSMVVITYGSLAITYIYDRCKPN